MPLQIRRGNTAEVNSITPLIGELIFNTQTGRVLVGDGATAGGVPIAGVSINEAKDAAAASLLAGTHKNISFSYDTVTKSLSATVDILTHETIESDAIITGKIFNAASTVIVDVDTATVNGTLIGNVTGDVKGSVFADDSTLLVDAVDGVLRGTLVGNVTGNVTGNILGDITGNVFGDVKGSIFADDSTLLVDAVDGVLRGTLIGNVQGSITGNIFTNLIDSADSSEIVVSPSVRFESDVLVENELTVTNSLSVVNITATSISGNLIGEVRTTLISSVNPTDTISVNRSIDLSGNIAVSGSATINDELLLPTNDSARRFVTLSQSHDVAAGTSNLNFRRSRGTTASPTVVLNNDRLMNISFTGFDGSIYAPAGLIRSTVDGTVSSGKVPSRIEFLTTSEFTGALTEKMYIGSRNEVRLNSELHVYSGVYDPSPMTWFQQSHATPDARNFSWIRTRGTIDTPLAVQSGDDIADLVFQGYDGVNTLSQVAAAITVKVDSAVSAGNVRGAFDFATYNGTSLANRVTISSAGLLSALNNLATPNIAPVATNGDLALDPASKGLGTIDFKAPEQSTVGAAGGASALPATPSTYLKVKINGNTYVIPAYLAS